MKELKNDHDPKMEAAAVSTAPIVQASKQDVFKQDVTVLISTIDKLCPTSDEKLRALNYLDKAVMWALAAMARDD